MFLQLPPNWESAPSSLVSSEFYVLTGTFNVTMHVNTELEHHWFNYLHDIWMKYYGQDTLSIFKFYQTVTLQYELGWYTLHNSVYRYTIVSPLSYFTLRHQYLSNSTVPAISWLSRNCYSFKDKIALYCNPKLVYQTMFVRGHSQRFWWSNIPE